MYFIFTNKKIILKKKQNKIIIEFNNQIKIIKKSKSLNEFKEKISNIFDINNNDLKNVIINMKSSIDELNENNEFYNDYILFNNLNNIVIEIIDLNNP